jgi:hypothetical protein
MIRGRAIGLEMELLLEVDNLFYIHNNAQLPFPADIIRL